MAARLNVRPTAALKAHPQWSQSDFVYFRGKGYSNQQILEFWERDLRLGCKPLDWNRRQVPDLAAPDHPALTIFPAAISSKLRPSPSSTACWPVSFCQRPITTSQ